MCIFALLIYCNFVLFCSKCTFIFVTDNYFCMSVWGGFGHGIADFGLVGDVGLKWEHNENLKKSNWYGIDYLSIICIKIYFHTIQQHSKTNKYTKINRTSQNNYILQIHIYVFFLNFMFNRCLLLHYKFRSCPSAQEASRFHLTFVLCQVLKKRKSTHNKFQIWN